MILERKAGEFSRDQEGSQMVEAALILIPLLAMIFLLMDVSWSIFVKATLQAAVREGARYGMAGGTAGSSGQLASIKAVVRNYSMGLLDGDQASTLVVQFYSPDTMMPTSSNRGGNLVIVSVVNYAFTPIAPFLHSGQKVFLTIRSGDRMETMPGGAGPAL